MTEPETTFATPRPGTVRDSYGDPCQAATEDSYPLSARCDHCNTDIRCADGSADWYHKRTRRGQCQP